VKARLQTIMPSLLIVMVPTSVFIGMNSHTIVSVVFGRGQFGADSIATTGAILAGLAIGFWASVAGYVLTKVMSAQGRNREVVQNVAVAAALSIAVNIGLYRSLGPVTLGLAASTSGITLLILTARSLGLLRAVGTQLLPLTAGAAVYAPIALAVPGTADGTGGIQNFALATAVCGTFWLLWIVLVPGLRRAAAVPARAVLRRRTA
jgi:peptidoglycan biosynthesis protein MviN/MurJ (putative lipid II flippase)